MVFPEHNNILFVGEAGSGKSEIAINIAAYLKKHGDKPVHFFDMDMTKPLFRSRDIKTRIEQLGIIFHYEEQFMDAPTLVGGVSRFLKDRNCIVVMDVGGDYIGARAIGGFAPLINRGDSMVCYVINPYRPWSYDMEHIDQVLGQVLGVSHIMLEHLHLIGNPNLGRDTSAGEAIAGQQQLHEMVSPYMPLEYICAREAICEAVKAQSQIPVISLKLYLNYCWTQELQLEGGDKRDG